MSVKHLDFLLEVPNIGLTEGYGQSGFSIAKIIQEVCQEQHLSFGLSHKRTIVNSIRKDDDFEYFFPVRVNPETTKDINIFMRYALPEDKRFGAKFAISMTMFETDVVPPAWIEPLNSHELVVTPTEWGAEIFKKYLSVPVYSIPLPVHSDFYQIRPDLYYIRPPNNKFRFITLGHYLPYDRKRLIPLIEKFQKRFAGTNAELYVKTNTVVTGFPEEKDLCVFTKNRPNIKLDLNSKLSSTEMLNLYLSSHCGLFPSLGEGFGLPQAEIGLQGIPLIVADNTAMTSMKEHYPWIVTVPCKEVEAQYHDHVGGLIDNGHWFECNMNDFLNKAEQLYSLWEKDKNLYEERMWNAHHSNLLRDFISHNRIKKIFQILIKKIMEKIE
jgi:hypothetical protein